MPDVTQDFTDDGFHEIHLSGKQLVFLFMLTTVLSIFIFMVGVLVGRDVAAKRAEEASSQPATGSEATTTEAADPGAPPAEPPPAPTEDELSYHDRLKSNAAAEEKPAAPAPEPQAEPPAKPVPAPAKPVSAPAPAGANVPTSGRPGTWVIQVVALKDRAAAAALVQRLGGKGYPAFLETPARGAPVIYRVRIGRYSDRREAEQVGRRLEKEEQFTSVITR